MTLALEAAKTDSDSANIRYMCSICGGMSSCNADLCCFTTQLSWGSTILEECKFAPDRIQFFTALYAVSNPPLSTGMTTFSPSLSSHPVCRITRPRLERHLEGKYHCTCTTAHVPLNDYSFMCCMRSYEVGTLNAELGPLYLMWLMLTGDWTITSRYVHSVRSKQT